MATVLQKRTIRPVSSLLLLPTTSPAAKDRRQDNCCHSRPDTPRSFELRRPCRALCSPPRPRRICKRQTGQGMALQASAPTSLRQTASTLYAGQKGNSTALSCARTTPIPESRRYRKKPQEQNRTRILIYKSPASSIAPGFFKNTKYSYMCA